MIKITDILLLIIALVYLGYSIWYYIQMDKILNNIKKITKNSEKNNKSKIE